MMIWNMPFERWYLGLFLLGFGVYLVVRARARNDLRRYFRGVVRILVCKRCAISEFPFAQAQSRAVRSITSRSLGSAP